MAVSVTTTKLLRGSRSRGWPTLPTLMIAFSSRQFEPVVQLIGAIKIRPFKKDPRHVGMADEAEAVKSLEDADELSGIGVNVVGKDVFVDRPSRRGMNGDKLRRLDPHRQIAQKLPSLGPADRVGVVLKAAPRPVSRPARRRH